MVCRRVFKRQCASERTSRDAEKALIFWNGFLGWTDEPKPMGAVTHHEIGNSGPTAAGCTPMDGDRQLVDAASDRTVARLGGLTGGIFSVIIMASS